MADRPHGPVILLPHEREADYAALKYPGVHSFRGGRMAAKLAYQMAGITNPGRELDFVELHDAYTSSEIQTYEDLGLCRYGEGGSFVDSGAPFLAQLDYGLQFSATSRWPRLPVNPSGGLLACGHPVGATGLMQAVFAFWQLQGTIAKHLGDATLQLPEPQRGLIHSHAGTGTYITVSILEKV
jgi:acetyl-CoA C-acetyltransferase